MVGARWDGRCALRFRYRIRANVPGGVHAEMADITVLLVADQELVRSGLRRILRRKDGFVIVAECSDGDEVPDAVTPP